MNNLKSISYVHDNVSYNSLVLQLCEEASELAKACAKLNRVDLKDNPTPVNKEEALQNVLEEFADVYLSFAVLFSNDKNCYEQVTSIKNNKLDRWVKRLKNIKCVDNSNSEVAKDGNRNIHSYSYGNDVFYVGDTCYGKSDGIKWTVVKIYPNNYPYVLGVVNSDDNNPKFRQVRCEWVSKEPVKFIKDKNGINLKEGIVVYKEDSCVPYTIIKINADMGKVQVKNKLGRVFTFESNSITTTFKDNLAAITNDLLMYQQDSNKYEMLINSGYPINSKNHNHFKTRLYDLFREKAVQDANIVL